MVLQPFGPLTFFQDLRVRAGENDYCLRPRGHCDRLLKTQERTFGFRKMRGISQLVRNFDSQYWREILYLSVIVCLYNLSLCSVCNFTVCIRIYIYCTMLRGTWSLLTTSCMCYATEDAVRIVNLFITIQITRNYIYSQLFLTLCHIYIAYNHIRSWLQSLITLLHWLTSQLSITISNYHTLSHTQSLQFTLRVDCDIFFVKLSPRTYSANSLLKTAN
jgi:hypothetical protein